MGLGRRGRRGGLEFQQDDIKTRERKRGDRQGHGEPRRETRRTQGGMRRKNKGFGKQQLRKEEGERKKESLVDETGLTLN